MKSSASKLLSFHAAALNRVTPSALGNSKRRLKNLASDLLNANGKSDKAIAEAALGCYLCKHTVIRLMEEVDDYEPRADTIERVLRYFNCEVSVSEVAIKPRYQNKEKDAG